MSEDNRLRSPCLICNEIHAGTDPKLLGHAYTPKEGIGYVRLLVIGNGKPEFCWRCGCEKSGWKNMPNEIFVTCPDNECPCHTAERSH